MSRYYLRGSFVVLISVFMVSLVRGQANTSRGTAGGRSSTGAATDADPDIPAAALLTDEGRRLAYQLQLLRRSVSALGPNHPSFGAVRAEIEAVKQRLATFTFRTTEGESPVDNLPQPVQRLTNDQLHEMVLQMSSKIQKLETRLFVLERQVQLR
jgi:hypothetical protein